MNDVCDSKNLSIDKYEFRHPADMSQVFDADKTIGEVGLNELRLVLKSESRYNGDFHRYHSRPDDIIKYKPSNVAESVSSSEISRSNLKNTSKTSPYSSTNSLNSLDSTGMNSSNKVQQPVAPIRKKKRTAPRPPSENSIPEQEIFNTSTLNVFKEPHSILPRKNFHVSSPQLYNNNINNNYEIAQKSDSNNNHTELRSVSSRLNAITRPSSLHFGSNTEIVKNLPERQRNNSESSEIQNIMRDSGSMQNSLERAKKKSPAPVPPTRKIKPTPSPRTIQEDMKSITEIKEVDEQENVNTQKIVGEIPIDNNQNNKGTIINKITSSKTEDENGNVSKVLLNNKSESSLEKTEGPISIQILTSKSKVEQQLLSLQQEEMSNESAKLPVVSKVHINHRGDETRSGSEAEEEEMTVNIYNVTKSVVTCEKPAIIKETNNKKISVVEGEQKHVIIENNNNNIVKEETSNVTKVEECQRSPSPEWTYTLPAPPIVGNSLESNNSNVNNNNNSPTDQKSVVGNKYFSDYTSTVNDNETILSDSNTTVISAETHIQPIINDRRKVLDDSFIINPNDYTKPSTAAVAISDNESDKSTEVITSDLEDGYLGNNNNNISNDNEISVIEEVVASKPKPIEDIQKSRLMSITRSDSFSIGQQKRNEYYDGMIRGTNFNALPQRSTSFLSLVHSQKAEMRSSSLTATSIKQDLNVPYNRQKSTSELSISDVPSLQSLEVIKNILNCRKSSLQEINRKSALSDDINNVKSAPIEELKKIHSSTLIEAAEKSVTSTTSTSKIEVKSTEKVIYNTIETRDIKKLETQKSEPFFVERNKNNNSNDTSNNSVKKSETQWRYSGPPKINFSTWNERPKVEVSVMSDEDYIFGGSKHSTTLPRDFKNQGINQYSQNQNVDNVDSYVRKSYSTVMVKNENKEAERHLPKVLGVEYKKDVVVLRNNNNNKKDTSMPAPSSEINNRNNSTKTLISIKQRPVTMDYSSAISSSTTKTTLNSPNYQKQFVSFNNNNNSSSSSKKFTPIVHGFSKLDNISETQSDVKSLPITNKITDANNEKRAEAPMIPVKPSYLRSASAGGDMSRNLKPSSVKNVTNPNNTDANDESPYSQTLRRTGLIEKMLNNDKKTESIFGKVLDKPKSTATNPSSNSVQLNEEKIEKVTIRQLSQPITSTNNPPPPPPPMIFRKSVPVVISGQMSEADTKSQLLDAIKNFNKDSLRRK
ncbi:hypothetical protein ACKWTF_009993 [Chironomus riparius]